MLFPIQSVIQSLKRVALKIAVYWGSVRIYLSRHIQACIYVITLLAFLIVALLSWHFWVTTIPARTSALAKAILAFVQVHPRISHTFHVFVNMVPDIAYLLLALAGLSYLMPEVVKKIETSTPLRVVVTALFVFFGLLAIIVNAVNRADQEDREGQLQAKLNKQGDKIEVVRDSVGKVQEFLVNGKGTLNEAERRNKVLEALRGQYVIDHPDVPVTMITGNSWPPEEWMNRRLREIGEKWTFIEPPSSPVRVSKERVPLDVRGEELCHEILDFAREAEQEEPTYFGGPNTSRDALDAMVLNRKNIEARISADFDKRFGGPLASITKEFAAKGITPDVTMIQPPPSASEIHLGGKALCAMVYTFRQKEGIPDPQMAERAQTYRTASRPCMGNPAGPDDPFLTDRADQVGIRAIDMANLIESKADACINTMRAGRVDSDSVRRSYASDIQRCCLEDIKKIHYSILSRCPTARDSMGEMAYNLLLRNEAPGVVSPSCDFDRFAKYFRELGQTMKDVTEWRH